MNYIKKFVIVLITLFMVVGVYCRKNIVLANKTFVNLLEIKVNGIPNEEVTSKIELIFDDDPGHMEEGRVVIQNATISKVSGEGNVRVLELSNQTFYDQQEVWLQFLWHSGYKDIQQQAHKVRVNQVGSYISFLRAQLRRDEDNPRNGTVTLFFSGDPGEIGPRTHIFPFSTGDYVGEEVSQNRNIRVYRFSNVLYDHELAHGAQRKVVITHNQGPKLISPLEISYTEVSNSATDIIEVEIDNSIAPQEFKKGDYGFSIGEDDIEVESVSVQDGKALLKINKVVPQSQKLDIRFQPSKDQPLYYKPEPIEESFVATGKVSLDNREATITLELNGKLQNKEIETTKTDSAGFKVNVIENGVVDNSKKIEIEKIETKENEIVLHVESEKARSKEEVKVTYDPPKASDKQLQFALKVQRNGIFRIIPLSEQAQGSKERLIAKLINKQKETANQTQKQNSVEQSDSNATDSVQEKESDKTKEVNTPNKQNLQNTTRAFTSSPTSKVRPDDEKKGFDSVIQMNIGNPWYVMNLNGKILAGRMDVPPQIYQNRTMLPIRKIAELLDVKVDFDSQSKMVHFSYTKEKNIVGEIHLSVREQNMTLYGEIIPLTAGALLTNNRILLPVSDVQKAFQRVGMQTEIHWEESTQSVQIYK